MAKKTTPTFDEVEERLDAHYGKLQDLFATLATTGAPPAPEIQRMPRLMPTTTTTTTILETASIPPVERPTLGTPGAPGLYTAGQKVLWLGLPGILLEAYPDGRYSVKLVESGGVVAAEISELQPAT